MHAIALHCVALRAQCELALRATRVEVTKEKEKGLVFPCTVRVTRVWSKSKVNERGRGRLVYPCMVRFTRVEV